MEDDQISKSPEGLGSNGASYPEGIVDDGDSFRVFVYHILTTYDPKPSEELINAAEHYLKIYLETFVQKAIKVGRPGKLTLEEIYYLVRRDAVRFERIKELLENQQQIKDSKKMLKPPENPEDQ
ncbi:hypothetical protein L596_027530 [Steinernema carpocapsae]|uniref:Transcription initiation factor TFIID subunit 13 n=1 Tax=Steinernema carpocapsae TaxID=34508 RepID=A0A4U5LVR5_STECR|nr:hypothetical protein L596_027530 [Steinernema carpocapsae]